MKPSFILHKDSLCVLEDLTNEQRGELFYAIYCYQIGKELELSSIIKIAFSQFKNQFVRDEEKFKKTVKARQEAGSKGGKQRVANQANASTNKQTKANQAVSDSVNESVSVSDSVNESKKEIIINNQEAISIASYLFESISSMNPSFKRPNINQWAKDIDLAMRIDGRTEQQLVDCVSWIYSDKGTFWQKNILSGKKLREKFDTMNMQVITKQQTKQEQHMNSLDMLKAKAMKKDGYTDEQIRVELSR